MNSRVLTDACIYYIDDEFNKMLDTYNRFNYKRIYIEGIIDNKFNYNNFHIYNRITIEGKKRKEIRQKINKSKKEGYHIIAVLPRSMEAARYAAVSKLVDLIVVTPGMERIIDESTKILLKQKGFGAIEIRLDFLLKSQKDKAWRFLYYTLRRSAGYNIPIVFSSCARSWKMIWHPYHILGIGDILGVPREKILSWLYPLL